MNTTLHTTLRRLTLIALFGAFALVSSAQSTTVKQFNDTADGYKVYLYQSMIRMLNKDKDPNFNKLIRDLDHLRFVTTDSSGAAAKDVFWNLDDGIQEEGFEEVMSVDNKDFKCHFYQLGADGTEATWVGVLFGMGKAGIIEMKGSIDLEYIDALYGMDMESLRTILSSQVGEIEDWD